MNRLFITFTLLAIFCANAVLAQSHDTETIVAEPYADTIKRTGKLDYQRTLNLSFKTAGYLSSLNIDEGEQFAKGQLLASLDVTELTEEKNANYARLLQAKREVDRISRLMKEKMASERDLDDASTQVETLRSAYQVSYYNIEKALIRAPFSGVVLTRSTELGEFQNPGQEALKIAKLAWVVKVALTGEEVSQIALGQSAKVTLNSIGIFDGVISKIPAIASNESNLFVIEVLLPNIEMSSGMIAGQLASVTIDFKSNKLVYRLPIAALVAMDEEGKAIAVAQRDTQATFLAQSFEVFKLDNDFVYLNAEGDDTPLTVITKGWQNFSVAGQ